ncbi:hypothetical protein FISHEDRAFT_57998 [Fistulina hepatica ATCC 64428]|uniref:Uncharacterized protein n=1 Tax=Fistulina hepatica ATCC 64428 TaxID=1128425 RepID=A0A0D7AF38_9AGAR|nr:hypothetical protein FISHEDRAFT_57998 [Fistulina hepatica ATCC 64428]
MSIAMESCECPRFLVHLYCSSSSPRKDAALLETGRKTIQDASAYSVWRYTHSQQVLFNQSSSERISSFVYNRVQPLVDCPQYTPRLKEWGEPVTDGDDIFDMHSLEEFKSTNFDFLADSIPIFRHAISNKRDSADSEARPPNLKKRRIAPDLETGSLVKIIALPHARLAPFTNKPANIPESLKPFAKTLPKPLPPLSEIPPLLPYQRNAWIVPIRGTMPWNTCTSAAIWSAQSPHNPVPVHTTLPDPETVPDLSSSLIVWNFHAVECFWSFLVSLQANRKLGDIGLSFQWARSKSSDRPPSLSALDYIKVTHDAPYSMHMRTLLDLWQYEPVKAERRSETSTARENMDPPMETKRLELAKDFCAPKTSEKIRVLKRAVLALVDNRNKGILYS